MSTHRKGIVFLLPQTDINTHRDLRDYATQMNNPLYVRTYDFNQLIEDSISCLHADGYGDYSPSINYVFSLQHVNDIKEFINKLNATSESTIVRILATDSRTKKTDAITLPNASHLAIMVFIESDDDSFIPTASHPNPPLFYQKVRSVDEAVIMSYAVSFDSIMCHAVGLCDDSFNFNDKKELSKEKVAFLHSSYFQVNAPSWFNNHPVVLEEIKKISQSISSATPYISLLSPFIPLIRNHERSEIIANMYAILWERFVIWYVQEHKRYIRIGIDDSRHIYHSLQTVKNYSGQIDIDTFAARIKDVLKKNNVSNGAEQQVFLVILRHLPNARKKREMEILFGEAPDGLHQGSWNIATSDNIKKYVGDENIIVHNMFITTIKEENDDRKA